MNRRAFLTSSGLGIAALGGCTASAQDLSPPEVTADAIAEQRWQLSNEATRTVFEQSFAGQTITAREYTRLYEERAVREWLSKETGGLVDAPIVAFFATRVDFSPRIDTVPGAKGRIMSRVEDESKEGFESRLEAAGMREIAVVDERTLRTETGHDADLFVYEAGLPMDAVDFDLPNGESLGLDMDDAGIAGLLACWHDGEDALVAGGAYPSEPVERRAVSDFSGAIGVTVELDFRLEPERYATECEALIRSVR